MVAEKMRDLRQTFLPLTAIIALVGAAVVAAWTGAQWKLALDRNTDAIAGLSEKIGDTWTKDEHDAWVEVMGALNPTLKLPPPSNRK